MLEESEASYDNSAPASTGEVAPDNVSSADAAGREAAEASAKEMALVQKLQKIITSDKKHFAPAFKRMKRDMFMAMHGRDKEWPEKNYKANIVGRHINQKVASIYAKNPKVVARRREQMDFAIWDETPESLQQAMMTVQEAMQKEMAMQAAAEAAAAQPAPMPEPPPAPEPVPEPVPEPEPPPPMPEKPLRAVMTPGGEALVREL